MALTANLVFYDVATGKINRIVFPEDDSERCHHAPMPGESIYLHPIGLKADEATVKERVAEILDQIKIGK